MFKITKNPEFSHPVRVKVPTDTGFADHTFTARFRALTITESEKHDTMSTTGTNAFLAEVLVGWEGVTDDEGQPVAFSNAARQALIDIPFARVALLDTYNLAMIGAKRGN